MSRSSTSADESADGGAPQRRRRNGTKQRAAVQAAVSEALDAGEPGLTPDAGAVMTGGAPPPATQSQALVPAGHEMSHSFPMDGGGPAARRPAPVLPARRLRRHREGAGLRTLLPPTDIPEDAEGRVIFIAITPPPDVVAGVEVDELRADDVVQVTEPLGPVGTAIGAVTRRPIALLMRGGMAGWTPIALLAVVFVIAFVVGMRLAK